MLQTPPNLYSFLLDDAFRETHGHCANVLGGSEEALTARNVTDTRVPRGRLMVPPAPSARLSAARRSMAWLHWYRASPVSRYALRLGTHATLR